MQHAGPPGLTAEVDAVFCAEIRLPRRAGAT
jgi:hypothetical protein